MKVWKSLKFRDISSIVLASPAPSGKLAFPAPSTQKVNGSSLGGNLEISVAFSAVFCSPVVFPIGCWKIHP